MTSWQINQLGGRGRRHPRHGGQVKREASFTLIEVICVLAIVGLVMGAVVGALATTVQAIKRTRESVREDRIAAGIAQVLRRDLDCAYLQASEGSHAFVGGSADFMESGVSLTFFTTNSFAHGRQSSAAPLRKVEYILQPSERTPGAYEVIRKEAPHPFGKESGQAILLAERLVDGVAFWQLLFHNGSEWQEQWRRDRLPVVIRLDFALQGDEGEEPEIETVLFSGLVDANADPLPVKRRER